MNNIIIKKAGKFIDVFHGIEGWETWTRFVVQSTMTKKKILKFVAGSTLSPEQFSFVKGAIL